MMSALTDTKLCLRTSDDMRRIMMPHLFDALPLWLEQRFVSNRADLVQSIADMLRMSQTLQPLPKVQGCLRQKTAIAGACGVGAQHASVEQF